MQERFLLHLQSVPWVGLAVTLVLAAAWHLMRQSYRSCLSFYRVRQCRFILLIGRGDLSHSQRSLFGLSEKALRPHEMERLG